MSRRLSPSDKCEDAIWLIDNGETPIMAAQQVGYTLGSLRTALRRLKQVHPEIERAIVQERAWKRQQENRDEE